MTPREQARRPHIFHMSTVHAADDTRVFWRETSGLAERGFRVTLVARASSDATRNGVRIIAMRTYRSRLQRMTVGVARALRLAIRARADVYHAHDPELIPALVILRLMGKRVIYDAHELLSGQVISKPYLPVYVRWPAIGVTKFLEWFAGRTMNGIVTVSEHCAVPYPRAKVSIVANYPELHNFGGAESTQRAAAGPDSDVAPGAVSADPAATRTIEFGYVGGLTAIRGAQQIVDAIGLANDGGAAGTSARLTIIGSFSPASLLDAVAKRPGWTHVDFLGQIPHDQVDARMAGCTAGIATFLPTPNNMIGSPNKLFEYMAMGLAVIISDFPAWRDMLAGVDCAYFVDPEDPAAIAAAMRAVIDDPDRARAMGATGRAAVLAEFNWERQLDNLVDTYRRIGVRVG